MLGLRALRSPRLKASFRRGDRTKKQGLDESLFFQCFVIPSGFEPETHSLEGCCSIQLSYGTSPSS